MSAQGCEACGSAFDATAMVCPYCRAPRGMGGLGRVGEQGLLERIATEQLLARADDGLEDLLVRDLGGPLSPMDLRDALVRVEQASDPSVADLEGSLTRDAAIALDGIALSELVDKAGDDMKIVRRGLVFLRNKRWTEALEWWGLHRDALDPSKDRLELLLLLMEAFTHRLAGDPRRAAELSRRINAHPLFRRMRGLEKK
ncbi:MAG: hypothetical protein NT062_26130 [Proteobacteria bacterium]|nr:hypothetical protein [Pseudomonadota bacterium]